MANTHRQFGLFEMFVWVTAFAVLFAADRVLISQSEAAALSVAVLLTVGVVAALIGRIGTAFGANPLGIGALTMLPAGIALGGFGLWGLASEAGQRQFQFLDGLYLLTALCAAAPLVLNGVFLGIIALIRPRAKRSSRTR